MVGLSRWLSCALRAITVLTAPPAIAQTTFQPPAPPEAAPFAALIWVDLPEGQHVMRRVQPIGDWRYWIVAEDFPAQAFEGREINIRFSVDVAANGSITDCKSRERSTPPAYLPRTCELIRLRGKFHPVLSPEGKPVAGSVKMTLQLSRTVPLYTSQAEHPLMSRNPVRGAVRHNAKLLPGELRQSGVLSSLPPSRPVVELAVTAEGIATRCAVRITTGTDAGDVALCGALLKARFEPAKGQHGDPLPQNDLVLFFKFGQ